MPSKLVVDRQKSAHVVLATEAHGPSIQEAFASLFAPYLKEDEELPDVALLLHLILRHIAARTEAMVAADEAHLAELGDDGAVREGRDEAVEALRGEVIVLRELLQGLYGSDGPTKAALTGETPTDPTALARKASEVAQALGGARFGRSRISGVHLDRDEWAGKLTDGAEKVTGALARVNTEAREADQTLRAKDAAIVANDEAFTRGAAFASALLRLVGEDELARKVRPSARKPGRTLDAEEDGGQGGGEA